MTYLRLPSALVDVVEKDTTFNIFFNQDNQQYNTLAILGKSVYHMHEEEPDNQMSFNYLFDISDLVDNNDGEIITNFKINHAGKHGVVSIKIT